MSRARVVAACVALLLVADVAQGLDPANAITQYAHTAWRVREGYFAGPPTALAQTRDGFLWIGSEAGLLRFDGVRFEAFEPPGGTDPLNRIAALLGASDGSLWIGTAYGLRQWKDGKLIVHATVGRFGALLEDRRGVIWAGHTRATLLLPGLCRMDRSGFRCVVPPGAPTIEYIGALYEDRRGEVWLGGAGGVCRWRSGNPLCYRIAELQARSYPVGVFALGEDAEGRIWADTATAGLQRLIGGRWVAAAPEESKALLLDRGNAFWIGTVHRGLMRRVRDRSESFSTTEGLTGDNVRSVLEDREGNVWVATSAGLDRFRDVKVATVTKREGLPAGIGIAVTASRDGGVWVADEGTLVRRKAGGQTYESVPGLPGTNLTSLFEDSAGRLWAGLNDGVVRLERGRFTRITMPDGSAAGMTLAIAEDREGDMWIAVADVKHLLHRVRGDRVVETFPRARGEARGISGLAADPNGGMWVGLRDAELRLYRKGVVASSLPAPDETILRAFFLDGRALWSVTDRGLRRFVDGRTTVLDRRHGLPCHDLDSAVAGADGALWLKGACGLMQISKPSLDAWAADPRKRVEVRLLDAFDGAHAGFPPFTPRAARSTDGRLWFAIEDGGLQVLDPARMRGNTVPPPVQVLRLVADRRSHDLNGSLRLPALTKDLEIDYTALSLSVPEKVRFRYRLDGADSEWQDVGGRRQAFYGNLPHGSYRFRVTASNEDGVWNETGAAVAFVIPPAFHQTSAFLVLCLAAAAALAWLAYRVRIGQVRTRLERAFDERLAERTDIAREIHDRLMQGLVSSSMQLHVVLGEMPAGSPEHGKLNRLQELMRQVVGEGRMVLRGLRTPSGDAPGLEEVLSRVPAELDMRDAATLRVVVDGTERLLRPVVREEVHRIAREALVNAFRHAHARNIDVRLEYGPRQLRVAVRDDGEGIDAEVLRSGREGHWGLSGMRERAERIGAKLKVFSRAGNGTEVELAIPSALAFED